MQHIKERLKGKDTEAIFAFRRERHKKEMQEAETQREKLYYEMKDYFKKNHYWIFFKPYGTEKNVEQALAITKKEKKGFPYFLGILKRI